MRIVSSFGLVFDMGCRDGDATLSLLRSFIDCTIFEKVGEALLSLPLGDSSSQCSLWKPVSPSTQASLETSTCLSVIDVANGTLGLMLNSSNPHGGLVDLPILTWGLFLSNTVARPRYACCT